MPIRLIMRFDAETVQCPHEDEIELAVGEQ
jgi:hypothetical protein